MGRGTAAIPPLRIDSGPSDQSAEHHRRPHRLDRIVARCLKKDPARRFQTMADLKVALLELKEETDSGRLVEKAVPAEASFKLTVRTLPAYARVTWIGSPLARFTAPVGLYGPP